jgi:hypothetical protein
VRLPLRHAGQEVVDDERRGDEQPERERVLHHRPGQAPGLGDPQPRADGVHDVAAGDDDHGGGHEQRATPSSEAMAMSRFFHQGARLPRRRNAG